LIANQTTSFFFVSGFGSGAYSAKLLNGTRQTFSGFSQPRQCGDDVFRMLMTGGPPVRGVGACPSASGRVPARSQSCGRRCRVVRKDAGHGRQVADVSIDDPEKLPDRVSGWLVIE